MDIRKGLPTTPGHPVGPSNYSRTFGRASRLLLDIRDGLSTTPDIRKEVPTTPGHPGGSPDHSQTSVTVSRTLPDI